MINQVVLVGRIVSTPELKETEEQKKYAEITIAVPRCYKNINGEYETDFVPIMLWDGIAESVSDYCRTGDLISVHARIESLSPNELKIVATKVSFLATKDTVDKLKGKETEEE